MNAAAVIALAAIAITLALTCVAMACLLVLDRREGPRRTARP